MKSILIAIFGATASGKSSLALQLAKRLGTSIISADSRQVYREFDIGTAKPSIAEQSLVRHHLIDICEPTTTLTLAEYQAKAQALIADQTISLLVGGTGLYLKAILKGLKIPCVSPQPELRSQLTNWGQVQLYQCLQQVDPSAAQKIHQNDEIRTLRALEVFYVSGRTISSQQGENPPTYPILQIGLELEPEALEQRIIARTQTMIDQGFVIEVEKLCQKYGQGLPLLYTLGFADIKRYLQAEISLRTAISETYLHTRQFAKRQRTWFRGDPSTNWFNANSPSLVDDVWLLVQEFLAKNSRL